MKPSNKLLLLICLICTTLAKAEDPHFTQWHANYNQLNPAYTGISNNPHLQYSYRNQWPSIVGNFVTNAISYDQRISPKAGYIGAVYFNNMAGDVRLTTNSFALQYSYQFEVNEDFNIRAGAEIGVFQRSIDASKFRLIEPDPRWPVKDSANEHVLTGIATTNTAANTAIGASFSYKNMFGGFAIHNLLEPMSSFYGNPTVRLKRRYTANVGAFLPLNSADDKSFVFAPYIVFQDQYGSAIFMPGINVNKGAFTVGVSRRISIRNLNIINANIGFSKGFFKMGYSYDYSKAGSSPLIAHELSLSFYFGKAREGNENGLAHYFRKMGI